MTIFNNSFVCLALVLACTACDDGNRPGNPDAYQGKDGVNGNECTDQFVREYDDVARTMKYVQADLDLSDTSTNREQTRSDAQSLRDKATALKTKYAGVNCVAKPEGASDDDKQSIDVNQRMDQALRAANAVLANLDPGGTGSARTRVSHSAPSGNEQCSSTFVTEYLSVTGYAKTVSDDLELADTPANRERTKSDAHTLKEQAKTFQTRHAGYKCDVGTGGSRYSIDVDAKMTDLSVTADQVISILNGGGSTRQASALLAPAEPAMVPIQVISQ